jgi:hypothetical protein
LSLVDSSAGLFGFGDAEMIEQDEELFGHLRQAGAVRGFSISS